VTVAQAHGWRLGAAGAAFALAWGALVEQSNAREAPVYLQWTLDPGAQHCESCADLDGDVRVSEDWDVTPADPSLDCSWGGGSGCRCELTEVDGPNG
jgi:hypothetical protein